MTIRPHVLIQLYVLRQLLLSVLFSTAGLAVIVLPTVAIKAVNKLGAISAGMISQYLPLVVAELAPYLLPLAFLLGVVATYGRLAAERELIAIKMAGIHPARLGLPGLLVALALALWTNNLLSEVSPELKFRQNTLVREADVSRFLAGMRGRNVVTFGDNVLRSESSHDDVKTNVQLDMELENGELAKVVAAEARIAVEDDFLVVRMRKARLLTETASFDNESPIYAWRLADLFPRQQRDRSRASYLTTSEMSRALREDALEPPRQAEFQYEIHRRHALSAIYLLFLLLGLPTGVVLRSSTQLGAFTGAVGYAFLYYVLAMRLGKVLAETGTIPPVFAAWAVNGLFLAVGLVLCYRTLWR